MKKYLPLINIVVFLGFISIMFFANLVNEDQQFSESENRVLAQMPKFSVEALFDGSFTRKFEDYITDQFYGRDFYVGLKALSEKGSLKLENNEIYFSNSPYLLQRFYQLDERIIQKNITAVRDFVNAQELPVSMILIPSSVESLADLRPDFAFDLHQRVIYDALKEQIGDIVIDLFEPLKENAPQNYFKTDHHFTIYGAKIAYEEFSQTNREYQYEEVSNDFKGTLYSKSGMYWTKPDVITSMKVDQEVKVTFSDLPDQVFDSVYFPENLALKDQYKYYLNGNHPVVTIDTNQPEKPNILIVRDSFGNIMAPYFVEDYNNIYFYDLRYTSKTVSKFIEEHEIDEVVLLYSIPNFTTDRYIENLR